MLLTMRATFNILYPRVVKLFILFYLQDMYYYINFFEITFMASIDINVKRLFILVFYCCELYSHLSWVLKLAGSFYVPTFDSCKDI